MSGAAATGGGKFDEQLSVLLIGDSGAGKTALLFRYACDAFSPTYLTTIGIDYKTKLVDVDGRRLRLMLWDTAGQERFRSIAVSYFRGANCILLVYDVTDRASFENVTNWMTQIEQHAQPNVVCVLVGNKTDCENVVVPKDEGDALADRHGLKHFRCSAKTGDNVDAAFLSSTKLFLGRRQAAGSGATASTVTSNHQATFHQNDPVKLTAAAGGGKKGSSAQQQCCGGGAAASSSSLS